MRTVEETWPTKSVLAAREADAAAAASAEEQKTQRAIALDKAKVETQAAAARRPAAAAPTSTGPTGLDDNLADSLNDDDLTSLADALFDGMPEPQMVA